MSNALSIQSVRPPQRLGEGVPPVRSGAAVREPAAQVAKPQPFTNPDLRLDPALGLVVIEFHDDAGKLTNSIPNQRQIDAYRQNGRASPGQPNVAAPSAAPGTGETGHGTSVTGARQTGVARPAPSPPTPSLAGHAASASASPGPAPSPTPPKGRNGQTPAG